MTDYEKKAKQHLTKEEAVKCHGIIHAASIAAGGVSAATAQIPLADSAIIVPTQMSMIIALGQVFGYKLSEGITESLIVPLVVQELGKGAAKSLVGVIPIAGNVVKAGISVTFTEALGWLVANHFAEGREQGLNTDELINSASEAMKAVKKMKKNKRRL